MDNLVTGATGFIGSHLVDQLLARGESVRCTVRTTSNLRWLRDKPVERVVADLTSEEGLEEAVRDVRHVYHVAGVIQAHSEQDYWKGNVLATRKLLEACLRAAGGCERFQLVTSLAASGPCSPGESARREETPCRPVSRYGRSKAQAEHMAADYVDRLPLTIVRPPVVYGPRDKGVLPVFRLLARGFQPLIGYAKRFSIIYVDDLVRGMIETQEAPEAAGECFFLTHGQALTYEELGESVSRALGKSTLKLRVPDRVVHLAGSTVERIARALGRTTIFDREKAKEITQPRWVCSAHKAEAEIGFRAQVGIEEGARRTAAWYRAQGWL